VKIHHALEKPSTNRRLVVAIGFFDGFHRGHREIVRTLLRARRPGESTAILTFRNHPFTYLRPDHVPPLINTLEERVDALGATGIDELFLVPFDQAIASLDARAFCESALRDTIGVRGVVIGENFRFGKARSGDATIARTILGEHGIDVYAVPPVMEGGERISSTRVRAALLEGNLAHVDALLADGYSLRGIVELGAGRGHDLGFPTANLAVPPQKTLPPDGVYTVTGRFDGRSYTGLVSIGTNPTFAQGGIANPRTVEVWLLDFAQTIYGAQLELRDFRFVREQRKFASIDELNTQMQADATLVRYPSFQMQKP
jgi:riboflavin kinase/FMN adenylyltransferase